MSIRTRRPASGSIDERGLIDTSVAVKLGGINSAAVPTELAVSTLTLAELVAGPYAARDDLTRARRRNHLRSIEARVETLPFDQDCAHAYGRVFAAVDAIGRKPRGARAVDLMIAATALANRLPLYTLNAGDFHGLDGLLEIVDLHRR